LQRANEERAKLVPRFLIFCYHSLNVSKKKTQARPVFRLSKEEMPSRNVVTSRGDFGDFAWGGGLSGDGMLVA